MKRRRAPSSSSSSSSSDSPSPDPKARSRPSSSLRRRRSKREPSPLPRKKSSKKRKALRTRKKAPPRRRRVRDDSDSDSSCSSRSCSTCSSRSRSPSRSRRGPDDRGRTRRRVKRARRTPPPPSSCSRDGGGRLSRPRKNSRSKGEERVEIIQEYGDDSRSSRSNNSLDIVDAAQIPVIAHSDEGDGGDRLAAGDASCVGEEGNLLPRLKSMVVVPAEPAEADDLELLLRQKALENLRRFRRTSSIMDHRSSFDDEAPFARDDQLEKTKPGETVQVERGMASHSKRVTETTGGMGTNVPAQDQRHQIECSGSSAPHTRPASVSLSRSREDKNVDQCAGLSPHTARPKNESLSSTRGSSANCGDPPKNGNREMAHETSHQNLLPQSSVRDAVNRENESGKENTCLLSAGPSLVLEQGATNRNVGGEGANEDSELESKTMTVMRGGELVQVKYKVYIPKKSPSSARRQLNR